MRLAINANGIQHQTLVRFLLLFRSKLPTHIHTREGENDEKRKAYFPFLCPLVIPDAMLQLQVNVPSKCCKQKKRKARRPPTTGGASLIVHERSEPPNEPLSLSPTPIHDTLKLTSSCREKIMFKKAKQQKRQKEKRGKNYRSGTRGGIACVFCGKLQMLAVSCGRFIGAVSIQLIASVVNHSKTTDAGR
jgi:hypothetical protein